ncbi:MAG TPA: EamA family transporter [Allosphingosinicella sp.]|jgi:drug/metabolite transporter (DMT)-like permease
MTAAVFFAVLLAALLHAGWNAVVKLGLDRFSSILVLALFQSAIAGALLPFVPWPAAASWPWLIGGSLLHTGYKLFLIRAYRHGELGQVYPLARGAAPLLVAVAGAMLLGERLSATGIAAIAAVVAGILLIALGGKAGARLSGPALFWALGTACFTAGYTLVDGHGARLSGTALGFALWLFLIDGLSMVAVALATRGPAAFAVLRPAWRGGLAAGAMSLGSYSIAIWAFTQAPLALVAALRETSILFALLIGALLLGERIDLRRWLAGALIVAGVVLMRL